MSFHVSDWSPTGAIIGELTGVNPQKSHISYEIVGGDNSNFFDFPPETSLLRLLKQLTHNLTVVDHHKSVEERSCNDLQTSCLINVVPSNFGSRGNHITKVLTRVLFCLLI